MATDSTQMVRKNWLGRKDIRKIAELLNQDYMERSGLNEDVAAHAFKIMLDKARSHGLIRDGQIVRKFKECTEKTANLEAEISQLRRDLKKCQDDFKAYQNRVQPLGKGRTETGGTEEAPPPSP